MPYFEICKQTRKLTIVSVSVRIPASLVKFRCRMMFKIEPYLGKHPIETKFCRFLFTDWDGFLIYFCKLSLNQTFRKSGRHVVTSVCSHASQKYPRIFPDREPIRAREKHYSLVWYMLMDTVHLLGGG